MESGRNRQTGQRKQHRPSRSLHHFGCALGCAGRCKIPQAWKIGEGRDKRGKRRRGEGHLVTPVSIVILIHKLPQKKAMLVLSKDQKQTITFWSRTATRRSDSESAYNHSIWTWTLGFPLACLLYQIPNLWIHHSKWICLLLSNET